MQPRNSAKHPPMATIKIGILGGRNVGKTSFLASMLAARDSESNGMIRIARQSLDLVSGWWEILSKGKVIPATSASSVAEIDAFLSSGDCTWNLALHDYAGALVEIKSALGENGIDNKATGDAISRELSGRVEKVFADCDAVLFFIPVDLIEERGSTDAALYLSLAHAAMHFLTNQDNFLLQKPCCIALSKWDKLDDKYGGWQDFLENQPLLANLCKQLKSFDGSCHIMPVSAYGAHSRLSPSLPSEGGISPFNVYESLEYLCAEVEKHRAQRLAKAVEAASSRVPFLGRLRCFNAYRQAAGAFSKPENAAAARKSLARETRGLFRSAIAALCLFAVLAVGAFAYCSKSGLARASANLARAEAGDDGSGLGKAVAYRQSALFAIPYRLGFSGYAALTERIDAAERGRVEREREELQRIFQKEFDELRNYDNAYTRAKTTADKIETGKERLAAYDKVVERLKTQPLDTSDLVARRNMAARDLAALERRQPFERDYYAILDEIKSAEANRTFPESAVAAFLSKYDRGEYAGAYSNEVKEIAGKRDAFLKTQKSRTVKEMMHEADLAYKNRVKDGTLNPLRKYQNIREYLRTVDESHFAGDRKTVASRIAEINGERDKEAYAQVEIAIDNVWKSGSGGRASAALEAAIKMCGSYLKLTNDQPGQHYTLVSSWQDYLDKLQRMKTVNVRLRALSVEKSGFAGSWTHSNHYLGLQVGTILFNSANLPLSPMNGGSITKYADGSDYFLMKPAVVSFNETVRTSKFSVDDPLTLTLKSDTGIFGESAVNGSNQVWIIDIINGMRSLPLANNTLQNYDIDIPVYPGGTTTGRPAVVSLTFCDLPVPPLLLKAQP